MSRPVVLPVGTRERESQTKTVRHPKTDGLMFGSSLADVFRTPAYDCKAVGPDQKPEFAVTRLRSGPRDVEKAPVYPPDQAVLICVSLTPSAIGQWKALYNGEIVGVTRAIPFATTFIDLNCKMEMWARGPFDYLHYYLSAGLLWRIALDNGVFPSSRGVLRRRPRCGADEKEHSDPGRAWRTARQAGTRSDRAGAWGSYIAAHFSVT